MRVSTPAAPPAPVPVSAGESMRSYMESVSDPALQQRILESEQQFRPQYAALNLADLNTYLLGGNGQPGALELQDIAAQQSAQTQADALSAQRAADIADVERLGGRASAAFLAANPQLQQSITRAEGLLGQGSTTFGEYQNAVLSQGDQPLRQATASLVGQGELGKDLYDQATATKSLGTVGSLLQGRAEQFAKSTGQLTPDEIRSLQQATREAYASRGVEMGSGAVSAEALSRLTNERARMQEDIAAAAALNQQNQAEIAANRGFQQSVYGQDLARQGMNQDAQNQFALANLQAALGQDQQRLNNLGLLGQLRQGQLGADRAYALQLSGLQQSVAGDPFQAILGRPSQALGAAQFQQQYAGGLASGMQGPQLFDPNAGVNLALQNNANQANYNASIFGAQAAASGQRTGGLLGAIGNIGGSLLGNAGLFG